MLQIITNYQALPLCRTCSAVYSTFCKMVFNARLLWYWLMNVKAKFFLLVLSQSSSVFGLETNLYADNHHHHARNGGPLTLSRLG